MHYSLYNNDCLQQMNEMISNNIKVDAIITDIPYGTYTVEEESAPTGYIKSNEKITFTVDDNHQSHQITITNTKETPVPDTGTESIIFALIGIIILGIGLDFILKNAKA